MAQEKKAAPDWERIEADYRAGILSLREMAAVHGITEGAIRKRAKRDGWARDLSAKIKAKADDLVRKKAVRSEVRTESAYSEREIIEAGAEAIARIKLSHRSDIARYRALTAKLLTELEEQTDNVDLFRQLGELLRASDEKGVDKRNDLYEKVISLPARTKTMKDLADTLKTLIGLEREAYGVAEAQKIELAGKDGGPIQVSALQDMTDDELLAIATAGGARAADTSKGSG